MLSTIGSSSISNSVGIGISTASSSTVGTNTSNSASSTTGAVISNAVLESQLDKCKTQLADWVSCPSHVTAEGKAKIKEISDKISAIEQQLKATNTAKQTNQQTATTTNITVAKSFQATVNTSGQTVGSLINVVA
jgi:hypothetical protein